MAQEHILSLYVSLISMTSLVLQQANSGPRIICLVTKPLNGINNCRRQDSCQGLLLHITNFQPRTRIDRMAIGLFSRRRWINRLAQKSSNYGMLPCMSSIIFGEPFILPFIPLGPILPSSPSTKEVHGMAFSSYLPEGHPGQSGMATFGLTWILDWPQICIYF